MKYADFLHLVDLAASSADFDTFAASCAEEASKSALRLVYAYAKTPTALTIRSFTGKSRAEFCRVYSLPTRTEQDWEREVAKPPRYLCDALAFAVIADVS